MSLNDEDEFWASLGIELVITTAPEIGFVDKEPLKTDPILSTNNQSIQLLRHNDEDMDNSLELEVQVNDSSHCIENIGKIAEIGSDAITENRWILINDAALRKEQDIYSSTTLAFTIPSLNLTSALHSTIETDDNQELTPIIGADITEEIQLEINENNDNSDVDEYIKSLFEDDNELDEDDRSLPQEDEEEESYSSDDEENQELKEQEDNDTRDLMSCVTCSTSTGAGARKGDEELKSFAITSISINICEYSCNSSDCVYGGGCVNKATIGETSSLRRSFWGINSDPAPSSEQRKRLIVNILENAYIRHENVFKFVIGEKAGGYTLVCESAFLILLGLSNKKNASEAPGQWKRAKIALLKKVNGELDDIRAPRRKSRLKSDSAQSYIDYICQIFVCDSTATAGTINMNINYWFFNCSFQLFYYH
jgi:hypothetical protein